MTFLLHLLSLRPTRRLRRKRHPLLRQVLTGLLTLLALVAGCLLQ